MGRTKCRTRTGTASRTWANRTSRRFRTRPAKRPRKSLEKSCRRPRKKWHTLFPESTKTLAKSTSTRPTYSGLEPARESDLFVHTFAQILCLSGSGEAIISKKQVWISDPISSFRFKYIWASCRNLEDSLFECRRRGDSFQKVDLFLLILIVFLHIINNNSKV